MDRHIARIEDTILDLMSGRGQKEQITGRKIIYATGDSVAGLLKKLHELEMPIRY